MSAVHKRGELVQIGTVNHPKFPKPLTQAAFRNPAFSFVAVWTAKSVPKDLKKGHTYQLVGKAIERKGKTLLIAPTCTEVKQPRLVTPDEDPKAKKSPLRKMPKLPFKRPGA